MINQNNMIIKLTAICLLKCSNYLIRRLYYIEYKFFVGRQWILLIRHQNCKITLTGCMKESTVINVGLANANIEHAREIW